MKKHLLVLATFSLIFASCGGDSDKEEDEDSSENTNTEESVDTETETETVESTLSLDASLDLSEFDIPAIIPVPTGTIIDDKSYGTYIVNETETFNLEVIYDDMDMYSVAERKEEMEENDMNVLKSYVVDDENGFIAETEVMGTTEYHCFYISAGTEGNFVFENVKGPAYTLAQAQLMYDAAKGAQVQ